MRVRQNYSWNSKGNEIRIFKNGGFWCLTINGNLLDENNYYFKTRADIVDLLMEMNLM